jgi:hypothetical protein
MYQKPDTKVGMNQIADELHKLASRRHDEVLHMLRDLHDATGMPMLWIGAPSLAAYLLRARSKTT